MRSNLLIPLSLFLAGMGSTLTAQNSGTGWTLVWSDEFSQPDGSSPDPSKWAYEIGGGGWGNGELEYYTARTNNVRIENGQLVIEAHQENYLGANYTSARIKTQGKASWTYGRMEARIKIPRGQGMWPAFWMLGTNISSAGWPTCGEIDIMENIGREPTLVHGTIHGPGYSGAGGIGRSVSVPGNPPISNDFHIFTVEWTPNRIKCFVDSLEYCSASPASLPAGANWVYTSPQFLLLNLAVGGGWPGNPDGTTLFPNRMLVDYVRVYAPTVLPGVRTNSLPNPGFEQGGLNSWTAYGAGFNTTIATISALPVHGGSNVFKLFGQFNSADNYSGIFSDLPASSNHTFAAGGWLLTPTGDSLAGANTAWLEVTFRDALTNVLALFRSASITSNSPPGVWLNLPITNQLDTSTFASLGSVTTLIAPPQTVRARYQVVFRQLQNASGSMLVDDLSLLPPRSFDTGVNASARKIDSTVAVTFPTFLARDYQVQFKNDLNLSNWMTLTNLVGDGTGRTITETTSGPRRFYRVTTSSD